MTEKRLRLRSPDPTRFVIEHKTDYDIVLYDLELNRKCEYTRQRDYRSLFEAEKEFREAQY